MRKTSYICTHTHTQRERVCVHVMGEQREIQAFSDLWISDHQLLLVYSNPQLSIDTNRKILVDCVAATESLLGIMFDHAIHIYKIIYNTLYQP